MFNDLVVLDPRVQKTRVKSLREGCMLLHELFSWNLVSCTRWFEVFLPCVVKSVAPVRKINRLFNCSHGIAFMNVNFNDGEG